MRDIFEFVDNFKKYHHVKSNLQYGDTALCPNPYFSVIMPVYGNPKYFVHSFNSVVHQDADFSYEVIIVDNTPIDDTKSDVLKLVESANLPYVFYYRNEENIGMSGNWNRGIELARANLLTFCHDDDMLYPNCLSKLWELHLKYPNKFIIPSCKIIDESVIYPLKKSSNTKSWGKECIVYDKIDILMANPTNGVGCLFYKKHMKEFGGYNEDYYPSMDNALHVKYVYKIGAIRFRQILYCYRITNNNESNNVYQGFIDNGLFYAQCMIRYITLPLFVKKALIHAYKTNITIVMEKVWARKIALSQRLTIPDRLVNGLLFCRQLLKIYVL